MKEILEEEGLEVSLWDPKDSPYTILEQPLHLVPDAVRNIFFTFQFYYLSKLKSISRCGKKYFLYISVLLFKQFKINKSIYLHHLIVL